MVDEFRRLKAVVAARSQIPTPRRIARTISGIANEPNTSTLIDQIGGRSCALKVKKDMAPVLRSKGGCQKRAYHCAAPMVGTRLWRKITYRLAARQATQAIG